MTADRHPLRIGIVHSPAGLVRGGLETVAAEFARGLAGRGHEVSLVTGYWPGTRPPAEIARLPARVIRVPCLPARRLGRPAGPAAALRVQSLTFYLGARCSPGVRRLVSAADVTLTFLDPETIAFARWRKRHGRPNVSYFAGAIREESLRADASVLRLATSETIAAAYRRSSLRIDGVVTPGIGGHWLEADYQVRAEPRALVFVGRLEPNKGIGDLLTIFADAAAALPGLELRLVGDGPLFSWVDVERRRLGLAGRITLAGSLPPDEVRRELAGADLFVFPSHYESFGIAVLEAMAAGLPVVCSDLPALREVTGAAACRRAAGDLAGWTAEIRRLLGDPDARRVLSLAGRERARCYAWPHIIEELEAYLCQATSLAPA